MRAQIIVLIDCTSRVVFGTENIVCHHFHSAAIWLFTYTDFMYFFMISFLKLFAFLCLCFIADCLHLLDRNDAGAKPRGSQRRDKIIGQHRQRRRHVPMAIWNGQRHFGRGVRRRWRDCTGSCQLECPGRHSNQLLVCCRSGRLSPAGFHLASRSSDTPTHSARSRISAHARAATCRRETLNKIK